MAAPNEIATDILLKELSESYASTRHIEQQRATMSNFLMIIAAALFAYIADQKFSLETIPISVFVAVLGLFGVFMSIKYGQRFHRHYAKVAFLRERLAEISPESRVLEIEKLARDRNKARYPFFGQRISVVHLWIMIHSVIFFIGIGSIILAFQ
jgi:hypothetical protein